MSSVTTRTEEEAPLQPQPTKKPFTRSASLQRIVQLNNYICTQNYILLSMLTCWLKTSQASIYALKHAFWAHLLIKQNTYNLICKLQKSIIYLNVLLIYCQFLVCVYFLTGVFLPVGLIFLIVSLNFMGFLYLSLTISYVKKREQKPVCVKYKTQVQKYDMGKKTVDRIHSD